MYDGLLEAQRYLHSFGITGWQDALIGDYGNHSSDIVNVYQQAIDREQLRAQGQRRDLVGREEGESQIENVLALRERFSANTSGSARSRSCKTGSPKTRPRR